MLKVDKFNVRIVFTGEGYGVNDCIVNEEREPLVEFYDDRYHSKRANHNRGQFVSRYYASTLLEGKNRGLCLDGGVREWTVSAEDMEIVREHLKTVL